MLKKYVCYAVVVLGALTVLGACSGERTEPISSDSEREIAPQSRTSGQDRPLRVFHVMSFHSGWKWTADQFNGFKTALEDLPIEYRVFEMDAKNIDTPEAQLRLGAEARAMIEQWQPDLIYASDDPAQEHVTRHFADSDIQIVFSGVGASPEAYGFDGIDNATGVLEHEHFLQSVALLKAIVPNVRRIAILADDQPMWDSVLARIVAQHHKLEDIQIERLDIVSTFEEFKGVVSEYQSSVDAIGLVGIFGLLDENGTVVPYDTVLRWVAEHSELPDFTFWRDRIDHGTLASMTVSGYEQGRAAGEMAREVLAGGVLAGEIEPEVTTKGEPVVSLARAQRLGIELSSQVLLSSDIVERYAWEE